MQFDCHPLRLNPSSIGQHDRSHVSRRGPKVKAPESSLIGPIFNAGVFFERSCACGLWHMSRMVISATCYEHSNRAVPTNEEVNIPDGECIFSEAVRLWWLTGINCVEQRCFKVHTTNLPAPIIVSFLLSQIAMAARYYFFTVEYWWG